MDAHVEERYKPQTEQPRTQAEVQVTTAMAPLLLSFDKLEDEVREARVLLLNKARSLLTSLATNEVEINAIRSNLATVCDDLRTL